jgi:hypothetical protein
MVKRIAAIGFIFFCTCICWAILGTTIFSRTYSSETELDGRVASSWGAPQEQAPPSANYVEGKIREVVENHNGKDVVRTVDERKYYSLTLLRSRVNAALHLDYRRKGLLWYSTYQVKFFGAYDFTNPDDQPRNVTFSINFPAEQAVYDDVIFTINGAPLSVSNAKSEMHGTATIAPHETAKLIVGYHSTGLEKWSYRLGENVAQARDFQLHVNTDFQGFDFPENSLPPTEEHMTAAGGAELAWSYANLVSGYKIGLVLPQKLQPGPLAGRISYFAPVSLLFFFFVMFVLTTIRGIELHPMNYFFLACAFFSFHLLMAYLVDHISIHAAFVICSGVSVFLVVSYLRLVVGMTFAALEAGLAQFIYLVLFSYAFFFEGFTGLAITIGAILTLFVVMQVTGRIRWTEKFTARIAHG